MGEDLTEVRSLYRNHSIVEQARSELGIDTSRAQRQFGIFTAAMGSRALRSFIGAPESRAVRADSPPIADEKSENLSNLLSWLFGDEDGNQKVIGESRDIGVLARVLASDEATEVLRETRDLEAAEATIGGTRDRLIRRLTYARGALRAAAADIDEYREDEEVVTLLQECAEAVEDLADAR